MSREIETLAQDPDIRPLLYETVNHADGETSERMRTYYRKHQRDEMKKEIDALDRVLGDPEEKKYLQKAGQLKQQNDRARVLLRRQSPPSLTAAQRDKLALLEKATLDSAREGMLSQEELRHKPIGAPDRQRAWEAAKKRHIFLWKNCRVLLNPQSDARDLANLERYRPAVPGRNLFTDGLIPGQFALSPQAKDNFDAINWDSPEVAAEIQKLVDEGKVTIRSVRAADIAPQARARVAKGKVFECAEHEQIFSGQTGKMRWTRHMKQAHGRVPSDSTTVAVSGGAA